MVVRLEFELEYVSLCFQPSGSWIDAERLPFRLLYSVVTVCACAVVGSGLNDESYFSQLLQICVVQKYFRLLPIVLTHHGTVVHTHRTRSLDLEDQLIWLL
jgi:hypothetical protein